MFFIAFSYCYFTTRVLTFYFRKWISTQVDFGKNTSQNSNNIMKNNFFESLFYLGSIYKILCLYIYHRYHNWHFSEASGKLLFIWPTEDRKKRFFFTFSTTWRQKDVKNLDMRKPDPLTNKISEKIAIENYFWVLNFVPIE